MGAFDDVDGVDLHIAEMLDRRARGLRPLAKRRSRVEPLGAQPDAPGVGLGQGMGFIGGGLAVHVARFAPTFGR